MIIPKNLLISGMCSLPVLVYESYSAHIRRPARRFLSLRLSAYKYIEGRENSQMLHCVQHDIFSGHHVDVILSEAKNPARPLDSHLTFPLRAAMLMVRSWQAGGSLRAAAPS
jgi:hypothetical protein